MAQEKIQEIIKIVDGHITDWGKNGNLDDDWFTHNSLNTIKKELAELEQIIVEIRSSAYILKNHL